MLLGGVSIFGGRGTLIGVVLALFLLGAIQKALLLSESISSYWIQIVTGTLLVVSVLGPNSSAASRRRGAAASRPTPRGGSHEDRMTPRTLRALLAALAVLATLVLAACGETKDDEASSSERRQRRRGQRLVDPNAAIKKGIKTVSIPKQLGNPYEEIEHAGVDEALKELGGTNRISARPTPARRRRSR